MSLHFAAVLLLCLLFSIAGADIKTLTINSDANPRIYVDEFDFTDTGHVTISVERIAAISYTSVPPDPSRLGFVLVADVALRQADWKTSCLLDSKYVLGTFRLHELSPVSHSFAVKSPNVYRVLFVNCASPLTAVNITVRTELYNLNGGEYSRDYLSTTRKNFSYIYLSFSSLYFSILGFWFFLVLFGRRILFRIHILMAGLLLIKSLGFMSAFAAEHFVSVGGAAHGWDVAFGAFQGASEAVLFAVIALIGGGWSTALKPNLEGILKKVTAIVVLLQVLGNLAGEEVLYAILDIPCAVVLLQVDYWREREALKMTWKLGNFWDIYTLVLSYLVIREWKMIWLVEIRSSYKEVVFEIFNLVFYTIVFFLCRPVGRDKDNKVENIIIIMNDKIPLSHTDMEL